MMLPSKQTIVRRADLDIVMALDPAISEKDDASRSAVVCVGMSPYNRIFLLEYWAGRQGDPFRLIEMVFDIAKRWQPRAIGVETVGYQKALHPFMERWMLQHGQWYAIIPMKPDRNEKKRTRILSIQPYARAGQLHVQRGMLEFLDEYESFPHGRTQDILDALAYAIRLLSPQQAHREPGLEVELRELARRDPMSARYWRSLAEKEGKVDRLPSIDEILEEDQAVGLGFGEFM